jgi:hypothetical protein
MIETYRGESFQFGCFAEAVCHSASDTKHEQHFTGMAQRLARRFTLWAHNSEVTRTKRVAGISSFSSFTEAARHSSSDVKHEHLSPGWRRGSARGS